MILVTHIALAFISIICVSYAAFSPSKIRLHITYLLTLGTILSGLIMLFIRPAYLGQACVSGIVYLGFMIVASFIARKRLTIINQSV